MYARRISVFGLLLPIALSVPQAAGGNERDLVLKHVPADIGLVIVATNLEELDKSLDGMVKRIAPETGSTNMLAGIRQQIKIGDWIDFTKPMALAMPDPSDDAKAMFVAHVPDFEEKMKGLEGATQEGGIWSVVPPPESNEPAMYAVARGGVVVGATVKELLESSGKESIISKLANQPADITAKPLLIHINLEPVKGKITQTLAMYGPMIGMMAGAQGGGNPQAMTGMMTAMIEALTVLVQQADSLAIALEFSVEGANATIASTFNDGSVKEYLAKQKPATMPMFTSLPDMPYFAAFGFHMPGEEVPFWSYMTQKMAASIPPPPPPPEGGEAPAPIDTAKIVKAVGDLYSMVQGADAMVFFGESGFGEIGQWSAKDLPASLKLAEEMIVDSSNMMAQFGMGGMEYKPLGKKKIGAAEVSSYSLVIDPNNPATSMMSGFYAPNSEMAMGVQGDRVRFGFGSPETVERAFATGHEKVLAESSFVKDALSALPEKRNAVLLLDIAPLLPMIGPMMGMPPIGSLPPGPPFSVSMTLAGEPARIDIHVPTQAIARITQAMQPEEPM